MVQFPDNRRPREVIGNVAKLSEVASLGENILICRSFLASKRWAHECLACQEERAEEERRREAGLGLYWDVDSVLIDQLAKTAA